MIGSAYSRLAELMKDSNLELYFDYTEKSIYFAKNEANLIKSAFDYLEYLVDN